MQRATTPLQVFDLHTDPARLSAVLITYKQHNEIILEKRLADLETDGTRVFFRMTQAETKLFSPGVVDVQARVKFDDDTVPATRAFRVSVDDVLNDEVL